MVMMVMVLVHGNANGWWLTVDCVVVVVAAWQC